MKPTRSILSPEFSYVDSIHTNIRATFARINRERDEQAEAARQRKAAYEAARDARLREALSECETIELLPPTLRVVKS